MEILSSYTLEHKLMTMDCWKWKQRHYSLICPERLTIFKIQRAFHEIQVSLVLWTLDSQILDTNEVYWFVPIFHNSEQLTFLDILTHMHLLPSQSSSVTHCDRTKSAVLLMLTFLPINICIPCTHHGSLTSEKGFNKSKKVRKAVILAISCNVALHQPWENKCD